MFSVLKSTSSPVSDIFIKNREMCFVELVNLESIIVACLRLTGFLHVVVRPINFPEKVFYF